MSRLAAIVLPLLLCVSAPVAGADDAEVVGPTEGWLLGDIRSILSTAPAAAYQSVASSMGNGDALDPGTWPPPKPPACAPTSSSS